jgi:hypothetical protein
MAVGGIDAWERSEAAPKILRLADAQRVSETILETGNQAPPKTPVGA